MDTRGESQRPRQRGRPPSRCPLSRGCWGAGGETLPGLLGSRSHAACSRPGCLRAGWSWGEAGGMEKRKLIDVALTLKSQYQSFRKVQFSPRKEAEGRPCGGLCPFPRVSRRRHTCRQRPGSVSSPSGFRGHRCPGLRVHQHLPATLTASP